MEEKAEEERAGGGRRRKRGERRRERKEQEEEYGGGPLRGTPTVLNLETFAAWLHPDVLAQGAMAESVETWSSKDRID